MLAFCREFGILQASRIGDWEIMTIAETGRARGGKARAEALTPTERQEIARQAANARWDDSIPIATHIGELRIGELVLPCAVLPDGTRVISQGGMRTAFGPVTGGWQTRKRGSDEHAGDLPPFLVAGSLKDFISNDLRTLVSAPRKYRDPRGGPIRIGFEATLLPRVCEVWLQARDKKALTKIQIPVSERADILMRGLAHTGIIALVDEATGYQDERVKTALQDIFNAFLRKELAAWVQRFPEEFYREIYRLRGWDWKGMKVNRPQVVAYYTVDVVYSRLLPHIMEELENRMPRTESGRRKGKLHQLFSDDIGHPALAQHLYAVITLMRVAKDGDWEEFMRMLNRAHPKKTDKWLKLLLQGAETISPPETVKDPIEPLPLFAQSRSAP
jgi:hypothetical protein